MPMKEEGSSKSVKRESGQPINSKRWITVMKKRTRIWMRAMTVSDFKIEININQTTSVH